MKCKKCGSVKLCKEFPSSTLSEECDHPPLHCLQCVTSHWEQTKQCSQCSRPIPRSSLNLEKCFNTLKLLSPKKQQAGYNDKTSSLGTATKKITVKLLNGEAAEVDHNPALTIYKVKQFVHQHLKVEPEKQRLVYNGNVLKDIQPDNKEATLATYDVKPGSTIHLMVLLYAVPANLDKVVFDLYWGYPPSGRDYLDASALVFSGKTFIEVADFRDRNKAGDALLHSGDLMDDNNRKGHHIIHVELKSIPANITSIFFTLSAWKSPTISHYKNPSFKFYELSKPDKLLCTDHTKKAAQRQAIVMCSLSRRGGQWFVASNGALSDGSAKGYKPLIATIQELITTMGD